MKQLKSLIILMGFSLSAAFCSAHAASKSFTLNINNQTKGLGNTQYSLTTNSVTSCTPMKGDWMPTKLAISCVDPIAKDTDVLTIHFEKYFVDYSYIWEHDINLRNVHDKGNVNCYIVGEEGNVRIECT